jgi:hypothetical protein
MRLLITLFLLSILKHEVSASIESYEKYFQDRRGSENGDVGVLVSTVQVLMHIAQVTIQVRVFSHMI